MKQFSPQTRRSKKLPPLRQKSYVTERVSKSSSSCTSDDIDIDRNNDNEVVEDSVIEEVESEWSDNSIDSDFNPDDEDEDDDDKKVKSIALKAAIQARQLKFKKQLHVMGVTSHFKTSLGGNKNKKTITTLVVRVSHLLAWASIRLKCDTAEETATEIVNQAYGALMDYCFYLSEKMGFKTSTLFAYMDDFSAFVKWFGFFYHTGGIMNLSGVENVLTAVRKMINKVYVKECGAASNDIPTLIETRRWPKGGMAELTEAVSKELPWILSIDETTTIDKYVYRRFMKALCASAYCSPQGRVQAVEDMRVSQAEELFEKSFILSSKSKTASTFGYQPVTGGELFLTFLDVFLRVVRPKMKKRPDDFLFIDLGGNKIDVGRKITNFFEGALSLHITTTTIRSIVETEMHSLHEEGKINTVQRNAIMNLNGHSSRITKDYYIRKDRAKDVANAFVAFKALLPAPDQQPPHVERKRSRIIYDTDSNDEDEDHDDDYANANAATVRDVVYAAPTVVPDTPRVVLNSLAFTPLVINPPPAAAVRLSINEPQIRSESSPTPKSSEKRVRWTDEEINYVGRWCKNALAQNPTFSNNLVARCLHHIHGNSAALSIFHEHHILNSGRLKHGFDTYKERNPLDFL